MTLLKISDASVDKATGLVEQLMGDNAKLLKLVAEKEEETAGWKKLMGDLKKLRIESGLEVEESVTAIKQSREKLKKELEYLVARRSIEE